jgi:hypothetical protein
MRSVTKGFAVMSRDYEGEAQGAVIVCLDHRMAAEVCRQETKQALADVEGDEDYAASFWIESVNVNTVMLGPVSPSTPRVRVFQDPPLIVKLALCEKIRAGKIAQARRVR